MTSLKRHSMERRLLTQKTPPTRAPPRRRKLWTTHATTTKPSPSLITCPVKTQGTTEKSLKTSADLRNEMNMTTVRFSFLGGQGPQTNLGWGETDERGDVRHPSQTRAGKRGFPWPRVHGAPRRSRTTLQPGFLRAPPWGPPRFQGWIQGWQRRPGFFRLWIQGKSLTWTLEWLKVVCRYWKFVFLFPEGQQGGCIVLQRSSAKNRSHSSWNIFHCRTFFGLRFWQQEWRRC